MWRYGLRGNKNIADKITEEIIKITGDREAHDVIINMSLHKEDKTILEVHAISNGVVKLMRQKLIKQEKHKFTTTASNF